MDYRLLQIIRCPLTKKELSFRLISEFKRSYDTETVTEIKDGILFSESGLVFPVIDGIPRMLIEACEDYREWLSVHMDDFAKVHASIQSQFGGLLSYCRNKNRSTKKSFALEWGLLDYARQDRIWHDDFAGLQKLFFNESLESPASLKGKSLIDVGCGHGMNTRAVAQFCNYAVGAELGKSIENAYKHNTAANVFFVQADLNFLPFAPQSFDVLLSGGVLHHTRNTELAFCNTEPVLKKGGKLCIWLYHPQKGVIHNIFNNMRKFTSRLPVRLQFLFYLTHIFPLTFILKRLKGKKVNWREEMIDLMDTFSPRYRHEHRHDEAAAWLQKKGYEGIKITTQGQYGFSIIGIK